MTICDIAINNSNIQHVSNTTFLGVTIDENLTWAPHINIILQKISCAIGILYKIRHFVPLKILLNIYNAIILPHLSYCTLTWGHCAKILLNKLYVLQKRALRAITNSHPRTTSEPLFRKFNILTIFQIHELQVGSFMYMYNKNLLPHIFYDMFKMTKDVHTHNIRDASNMYIPLLKYQTSRKSVNYSGVMQYQLI